MSRVPYFCQEDIVAPQELFPFLDQFLLRGSKLREFPKLAYFDNSSYNAKRAYLKRHNEYQLE
ncbi:hypothetical protein Lepto7375DRAFT_1180 [Leptolyngbya sp. PCC 7375]|nr:hypothetical protein Lepto7375DRAFT_1180 [Leptolyngbya sp. PCC 7375]